MSNKIKSIKTFYVSDNTDGEGLLSAYEERDSEGNIILHIQFNEKEEIEQKTERIFDDKGRLVEEKQYTGGERPDQHIKYSYNESGKVAQATVLYLDGSTSFRNYLRDESKKITTIEIRDDDGTFEGKEIRRFDEEGRVLEEVIFDEDNEIVEKTETEFDDFGRIIENVYVDMSRIETVRFYDYYTDEKGRVNKIETLDEDETIIRTDEIKYDERGNQTKYIASQENNMVFTDIWEYDLQNRITNHKRMRGDNLVEEVKNKYRDDNLLTERETLTGNGIVLNYFEYSFH